MSQWNYCQVCEQLYPPGPGPAKCPDCGERDFRGVEL